MRALRAAALPVLLALAGCSALAGVQEPPPPVHGPDDLGQPLGIHVQNNGPDDLRLRITLAGQDEVRYRMTAGMRGGESVIPHVGHVYEGSVPPGSEVVVRMGDLEERVVLEDRGGPAWLVLEPAPDGTLGLARYDEQPMFE